MWFQKLCQCVLTVLGRQVQPTCQRTCLETLRILSRDKCVLAPVATRDGMLTLGRMARLHVGEEVGDNQRSSQEGTQSEEEEKVVIEALKCLCNVVYNSLAAQQVSADVRLAQGLCASLHAARTWHHEVGLFTLRLLFLLSALLPDVRGVLTRECHAVNLLTDVLEQTLDVRWEGPYEAAAPAPQAVPTSAGDNERAMEALKALFNLTLSDNGGRVSVLCLRGVWLYGQRSILITRVSSPTLCCNCGIKVKSVSGKCIIRNVNVFLALLFVKLQTDGPQRWCIWSAQQPSFVVLMLTVTMRLFGVILIFMKKQVV